MTGRQVDVIPGWDGRGDFKREASWCQPYKQLAVNERGQFYYKDRDIRVVNSMVGTNEVVTCNGYDTGPEECYWNDVQHLPYVGTNIQIEGNFIKHWEFPNFEVPNLTQEYASRLYVNHCAETLVLSPDADVRIDYMANKSIGLSYYYFSVFTREWHYFSHYKNKLHYWGKGYHVGQIQIVGDRCGSTDYRGVVRFEDGERPVIQKPLYNLPDYDRGNKDGVIISVFGVEHKLKHYAHDLCVSEIGELHLIADTNDRLRRIRCPLPNEVPKIGDLIEIVGSIVTRVRSDKSEAETFHEFDQIENSLSYIEVRHSFFKSITSS